MIKKACAAVAHGRKPTDHAIWSRQLPHRFLDSAFGLARNDTFSVPPSVSPTVVLQHVPIEMAKRLSGRMTSRRIGPLPPQMRAQSLFSAPFRCRSYLSLTNAADDCRCILPLSLILPLPLIAVSDPVPGRAFRLAAAMNLYRYRRGAADPASSPSSPRCARRRNPRPLPPGRAGRPAPRTRPGSVRARRSG